VATDVLVVDAVVVGAAVVVVGVGRLALGLAGPPHAPKRIKADAASAPSLRRRPPCGPLMHPHASRAHSGAGFYGFKSRSISRRQADLARAASTVSGCTIRVNVGSPGPRWKAKARASVSMSPFV
jgi:hypothetical protein